MPGKAAGGTGRGRKRWGWAALMAGAFLAGLMLVGVILLRAPETERPAGEKLADTPVPASPVASDNGAAGATPGSRLAIVVDGFGYDPVRDAEWLDFPERITVSVLPYGPSSRSFAASARTHGFGVILHVPMESEGGVADRTAPFLLLRGMTPEEITSRFARMAADVPQANGASNHMGSAFTSDPGAMASFAQALKGKGFFFLDSVTSAGTVALMAMEKAGVPAIRRDVFLDNESDRPAKIRKQFDELTRVAKQNGRAIGIGHPHPATIAELRKWLAKIDDEGIEIVPVSALVK